MIAKCTVRCEGLQAIFEAVNISRISSSEVGGLLVDTLDWAAA